MPACEMAAAARVIFVGTILDHNDDGSGRIDQWTNYLVRVEEAFHGLAPGQKEVFVDPGSFSSCYGSYQVGGKYLFYAGPSMAPPKPGIEPAMLGGKQYPARWEDKRGLPVFGASSCQMVRLDGKSLPDLAWLRSRKAGALFPARLYGKTYQGGPGDFRPDASVPLPLAKVEAVDDDGRRFDTQADINGSYEFHAIPSGRYTLRVRKEGWAAAPPVRVDLQSGGCAQRNLGLIAFGSIQGVVTGPDGKPVPQVYVELVQVFSNGLPSGMRTAGSETDSSGIFRLRDVPAGEFVIGVNLTQSPSSLSPYASTWAPGVHEFSKAQRIRVGPREAIDGVMLRLTQ